MDHKSVYKESLYNISVQIKEGEHIVYNSKTGAIALLDSHNFSLLKNIRSLPRTITDTENNIKAFKSLGFIVEEHRDEFMEIRNFHETSIKNHGTLELTILPAESCNFSCPYCFEYNERNILMKKEVFDSILKFLEKKASGFSKLILHWYGGEPLLAKNNIIAFQNRIKQLSKLNGFSFHSAMITNGYLLTAETLVDLISCGINMFQITIDGTKETHDKLRILKNGAGTFETIYNNLLEISKLDKSLNFTMQIRVNFTNESFRSAFTLAEDLFEKILKNDKRFGMYFRPVYNFETAHGRIEKIKENLLRFDDGRKMQFELSAFLLRKYKQEEKNFNVFVPHHEFISIIPTPIPSWCQVENENSLIIGADGSIYSCDTYVGKTDEIIAYLDTNGEIKIHKERWSKWKSSFFDNIPQNCAECKLLPICMGGCKRRRLQEGKGSFCFINLKEFEELLRTIYLSFC